MTDVKMDSKEEKKVEKKPVKRKKKFPTNDYTLKKVVKLKGKTLNPGDKISLTEKGRKAFKKEGKI